MKNKGSDDFMLTWVALIHSSSYLLISLSRYLERKAGLTLSEQDMLARLNGLGGTAKMSDLAGLVFVTKAGMTKMVDRIEQRGWVERRPSPDDRRVKLVHMKPAGKKALENSWRLMRPWIKANFADYLSEDELTQLGKTLRNFMEKSGHWETMAARLKLKDK